MRSNGWNFPIALFAIICFFALGAGSIIGIDGSPLFAQEEQPSESPDPKVKPESKPEAEEKNSDKSKKQEPEGKSESEPKQDPQEKSEPSDESKTDDDTSKDDEAEEEKESKEDGVPDLNKAFDLKLEYRTTADLDRIIQLCESALKKKLNDKDRQQAKELAASSCLEFAKQASERIFLSSGLDKRWQYYRAQALPKLNKAVKFDEKMVDAYILLAKLESLAGGDKENARLMIEKALEFVGDDPLQRSAALYVRASLASNNMDRLEDLNEAIKLDSKNLDALKIRASFYVERKDAERALADYQLWLAEQPEDYQARVMVVESLMKMGDGFNKKIQDESVKLLDEAIELKPDFTVPYTFKAQLFLMAEKHQEVVEAATKALDLEPKNIRALELRADALAELGLYEKSVEDCDRLIQLQGFSLDGVSKRGIVRIRQGNFEKAIEDFETLSSAAPRDIGLKVQLAALYNANDEPSKAVKIYTPLLRRVRPSVWEDAEPKTKVSLMRQRVELLQGRGDAQLSMGQHKDSIKDYEEAIELAESAAEIEKENGFDVTPVNQVMLNNLAWLLATSPDDEVRNAKLAIDLATRAAEATDYKEAYILSTLASGYAEDGDFDKAIEWIEKALKANEEAAKEAVDKTDTDKRFKSLNDELESYKNKKPWRELENVEEEKKAKSAAKDSEADGK